MLLTAAFPFALLVSTGTYALQNRLEGFFDKRGLESRKQSYLLLSSSSAARSPSASTHSSSPLGEKSCFKEIVFIRHGQTYMNEYLGGRGISFGEPYFTDVFREVEDQEKFYDSPLSTIGLQQAKLLNCKLKNLRGKKNGALEALGLIQPPNTNSTSANTNFLDHLDLVVTSPLTRALQTFELALYENIIESKEEGKEIPILALAAAAERLYLVSDIGKPKSELALRYPFVDFDTAFLYSHDIGIQSFRGKSRDEFDEKNYLDAWHFKPSKQLSENYVEWRPHGQGQAYACLGEPAECFDRRMSDLYYWLESREEKCIAIISHAGVIDWMTSGEEFSNCELRVQSFDTLRPRALQDRRSDTG